MSLTFRETLLSLKTDTYYSDTYRDFSLAVCMILFELCLSKKKRIFPA